MGPLPGRGGKSGDVAAAAKVRRWTRVPVGAGTGRRPARTGLPSKTEPAGRFAPGAPSPLPPPPFPPGYLIRLDPLGRRSRATPAPHAFPSLARPQNQVSLSPTRPRGSASQRGRSRRSAPAESRLLRAGVAARRAEPGRAGPMCRFRALFAAVPRVSGGLERLSGGSSWRGYIHSFTPAVPAVLRPAAHQGWQGRWGTRVCGAPKSSALG